MKESPIIFSTPMVRAILDCRKTQTRRIVKPQPDGELPVVHLNGVTRDPIKDGRFLSQKDCPYGQPGDRLWVREVWAYETEFGTATGGYLYRADGDKREREYGKPTDKWRSPWFMTKKAARIWLRITNVRVERLQEISEKDAKAEGVDPITINDGSLAGHLAAKTGCIYKPAFSFLWDEINLDRAPWDSNPWVWVIEFAKVTR
jgi:hypothetical protein